MVHPRTNLTAQNLAGRKRKLSDAQIIEAVPSPLDLVNEAFKANGFDVQCNPSWAQLPFESPTQEMIQAYQVDTLKPIREENLEKLRELHQAGKPLHCCNRFGESLMHMACRRGSTNIVRFLIHEAKVSLLIRDDYGRTPLHDACWTSRPQFDLVEIIIKEVPEMLCSKDIRGHTPLSYIRKEHWGQWRDFFVKHRSLLRPRSAAAIAA